MSGEPVMIVAGDARQADDWRYEHGIPRRLGIYASSPQVMYGFMGEVVFVGTWQQRKDAQELQALANTIATKTRADTKRVET